MNAQPNPSVPPGGDDSPHGTSLVLGPRTFAADEFAVMAIINRTPDSFYEPGSTFELSAALEHLDAVVDQGADIVDVGGVRAGYGEPVNTAEEVDRTAEFVALTRERYPDLVISVDTWRSEVANQLCALGAHLINDTWAGYDPELAAVAAEHDAGLVCSHTGGLPPRTDPHRVQYDDVVADVLATTTRLARLAQSAGVRAESILIDPTHDFGKNTRHSLELTRRLDEMTAAGWPVLVALSRKDFIGETLNVGPEERLEGTLAATAISAWHGARVFRAHDIAHTRSTLDMVASIAGSREPEVNRRGLA